MGVTSFFMKSRRLVRMASTFGEGEKSMAAS